MTEQNQQSSLLGKIAAYTEIWAKDPNSTIFVSLSEAYRKMGMLDDAKDVVIRGLEKNPEFSPAHIVLARILCQQGDYQGSEASFQRALAVDASSLAALVGYARLQILLGRENDARNLLLEARKLSPADSVINKLLLSLPAEPEPEQEQTEGLSGASDEGESEDESEEPAREEATSPPLASATLAELYLKQGLEKEALEMFRQLSAQKPNDLMLRRQIRNLEERLNGSGLFAGEIEPAEENSTPEASTVEPASAILQDDTAEAEIEETPEPEEMAALGEPVVEGAVEVQSDVFPEAAEHSTRETILTTLNQWLDNIQQRRGDV